MRINRFHSVKTNENIGKSLQEFQKNLEYANQSISFGTKYKRMIQISVFIEFI